MRFFPVILLASVLILIPALIFGALNTPDLVYPTEKDSPVWKGQIKFQWNTTAPFSEYHLNLPSGESEEKVIGSLQKTFTGLPVGEYSWAVRSCNNAQGTGCGDWSATQTFSIIPAPLEVTGGLIPCGRQYDDPLTANDESKPCGFSHIILLIKNVLDFVLWRLGLLIIVALAVFTGFFTYFSFGAPDIGVRIKTLWRALFVGYLVLLFAWVIINVVLGALGFQVQFFGSWWQLPF